MPNEKKSREIPKLFPLTAQFGSFEVKLGASDNLMALNALENIDKLFKDFTNLDAYLVDIGLDPHRLKDLVDLLNKDNLKIQVSPKFYDVMGEGFSIGDKKLHEIIDKLESSTITFIDSTKVPQANDIYKVIDIVSKRKDGMPINHENIDGLTSDRQVKYYTDAAYCLGLLNKNTTITAAGRTLCYRDNLKEKLEFLADRFESSDFGIAWMSWAKVTTMMKLKAEDSELFIEQCVKGLNDATAKRRSTTLKSWLNELKNHRREYQDQ